MVDVLGGFNSGQVISDAISGVYTGLIIILVPLALFGIFLMIRYLLQFKHQMLTELVTGGKNVMRVRKFREKKTKEGIKWQLMGSWEYFPPAPAKCIKTTTNGRMFVEMAYSAEGNYQWKLKHISPESLAYVDNDTDRMAIKPEESFTTVDRQWFIEELRLAEARKKKEGFLQKYGATMMIAFIFLMALSIVIFGSEEVFKPALEAQKLYLEAHEREGARNERITNMELRMEQLEAGVQEIGEEIKTDDSD